MQRRTFMLISIGVITGVLGGWLIGQWYENQSVEPTEQLFVYGTLQNPVIRFLACRCLTPSKPYLLEGFQVANLDLRLASAEAQVVGKILTVTSVELARFDRYERTPDQYVRVRAPFITDEPWIYLRSETASTTLRQ